MPTLRVNGIDLYYEEAGHGPALVCISGVGATHESWAQMAPYLSASFRTVVFDNRGSGRSSMLDEPYRLDRMARDAAALMDALEIESAHVAGHSMGSAIALLLARQFPGRVKSLILCNPFSRLRESALFVFRTNARLWRGGVPEEELFRVILPWIFSDRFFKNKAALEQAMEIGRAQPSSQTVDAFERQLDALEEFSAVGWLSDIEKPVLILAGDCDVMTPAEEARRMAQQIPGCHFELLPTAHGSILEDSGSVVRAMQKFFARLGACRGDAPAFPQGGKADSR